MHASHLCAVPSCRSLLTNAPTASPCRDGSRISDEALLAAEEKYHELIDQLHER